MSRHARRALAVLAPLLGVVLAQAARAQPQLAGATGASVTPSPSNSGSPAGTTTAPAPSAAPSSNASPASSTGAAASAGAASEAFSAGGLTADTAADRAIATAKSVKVDEAKLRAVAAAVDTAWDAYLPRLTFTGRYTRLSPIDLPSFGSGSIVFAPTPAGPIPPGTQLYGGSFSFPVFLNNYLLQASIAIPLSDYVFRIYQAHEAALKNEDAAKWTAKVTQQQTRLDARVGYYNWLRARGSVIVAEAAIGQSEAHLKDLKNQLALRAVTTADVYRVEAQRAAAQLALIQSENLVMVTEANLRLLMHVSDDDALKMGEDLTAELPKSTFELKAMKAAAMSKRPELKAIDAQIGGAEESKSVLHAGLFPRLDGFGNLYYSNPNQRFIPATDAFKLTWDVGLQLTWSPNDAIVAGDQEKQADANIGVLKATREQLVDALDLEVVSVVSRLREAEGSVVAAGAQLRAAEEAYRVRLEQFHNGAATSSLLIDAETDLTRARLAELNARVDLRIARAQMKKATGD